jgi:hypothetical protein
VIGDVDKDVPADGVTVGSLRQRIGERLLASGTEMAFDREHIARGIAGSGTRTTGPHDDAIVEQALLVVQWISRVKVRLGLLLVR